MRHKLEKDGVELTLYVLAVSPVQYEGQTVINQLLDGTYHVQCIGKAQKSVMLTLYVAEDQASELNRFVATGERLMLDEEAGMLRGTISWKLEQRGAHKRYSGTAEFVYLEA